MVNSSPSNKCCSFELSNGQTVLQSMVQILKFLVIIDHIKHGHSARDIAHRFLKSKRCRYIEFSTQPLLQLELKCKVCPEVVSHQHFLD